MIDALTARALAAELQGTIAGGRVQSVYFLSPLVIGLEVYAKHKRHYVLLSAEPQRARALLVNEKLRTASVPLTPFLLLLKKYVNGAFLNHVQVIARERILLFEFDQRAQGVSTLVVELMGNRANMILLDAGGIILDALRRVPSQGNRGREIVPRAKYFPPPPQPKADPLNVTQPQFLELMEKAPGETLAEKLVASIAGTSPLYARELAFRVTADTKAAFEPILVKSLLDHLVRTWMMAAEPTLALENEQPVAVAAFGLTHLRTVEMIPSMSAALETYFGTTESYESVKAPLLVQLKAVQERLERARANMQRELLPSEQIERLKMQGEMILGYQYELTEGQSLLHAAVTEDFTLDIALDPKLNAVDNANRYFDEYKRARDAQERVPERIATVEHDIEYVQQLINDMEMAESRAEIDLVMDEARQAGVIRDTAMRTGGKIVRAEPRHFVSPDNFQVLVGRNARQNDALTFERAHPEDVWLHARGVAGSHVIIQSAGRPIPESTLEFAAALAAYYSQARTEGRADVVYTFRKNVHRVRGAGAHPGLVTVRGEQVVRVKPQSPERTEE